MAQCVWPSLCNQWVAEYSAVMQPVCSTLQDKNTIPSSWKAENWTPKKEACTRPHFPGTAFKFPQLIFVLWLRWCFLQVAIQPALEVADIVDYSDEHTTTLRATPIKVSLPDRVSNSSWQERWLSVPQCPSKGTHLDRQDTHAVNQIEGLGRTYRCVCVVNEVN